MREIDVTLVKKAVKKLILDASFILPSDLIEAFDDAYCNEESPLGKMIIADILKNAQAANKEHLPLCQDTGMAIIFLEIGQDVHFVGGLLEKAINEAVKETYEEEYLRKSLVFDPVFENKNTGDNTPAIIHYEIVEGDKVKIEFAAKGGGSENMSTIKMLKPSDGAEGIKNFVAEWVKNAGSNFCPPGIVGIGVGGSLEKAAFLAKKALLRPIGLRNPIQKIANFEEEIKQKVNNSGVGPMGLGGRFTILDVFIEVFPRHIATLPVAVNLQCHSARHKSVII